MTRKTAANTPGRAGSASPAETIGSPRRDQDARGRPSCPDLDRFRAYRETRDPAIRASLCEEYAGFAAAQARRYDRRGVELSDLHQVALVGLLHAIERFNPDRGVRFTTFAEPTVVGELRRYFRDRTWSVRVTRRHQDLSRHAGIAADALAQRFGRRPTHAEIAAELDVEIDDLLSALDASQAYRSASLDAVVGDESPLRTRVGEIDLRLDQTPSRVTLRHLLAQLPERERELVRLRFEEGLTQSEIAGLMGMSQMHVSRLLRRTLALLRSHLGDDDGS